MRSRDRVTTLRRRRSLGDRWLALLLIAPATILILSLDIYPIFYAGYDSLFRVDFISGNQVWVGAQNYFSVLMSLPVRDAISRSLLYTVANTVIEIVVGTAIALLLNEPLRGRTVARGLVLFPFLIPAVVVAIMFQFIFNPVSGIATYLLQSAHLVQQPPDFLGTPATALWTVIIVHSWKFIPFTVIVVLARLQIVPQDLYEAAKIDGARRWMRFWHVTMPWLMPVILIVMLVRTIWNATDYDVPYLLDFGGPVNATTVVPIEIRSLAFDQNEIGAAAALAICVALVLVVAAIFYLRLYDRSAALIE